MFKNWTWKEWTAFALAMVVLIGEVVLVFVQPWSALYAALASVFSFVSGWVAGKHIVVKAEQRKQ